MKNKIVKGGFTLLSFLVAGAMAFATVKGSPSKSALVTGYIFQSGQCIAAPMDCNELGNIACTYLGSTVYRTQVSGTSCADALSHRP